jgi:hypothetical protein
MTEIKSIDLDQRVPDAKYVRFLRAEWWDDRSRFVLIRYATDGKEKDLGLRLDLDKKIFLDHVSDPDTDKIVQSRVGKIWEIVAAARA